MKGAILSSLYILCHSISLRNPMQQQSITTILQMGKQAPRKERLQKAFFDLSKPHVNPMDS